MQWKVTQAVVYLELIIHVYIQYVCVRERCMLDWSILTSAVFLQYLLWTFLHKLDQNLS